MPEPLQWPADPPQRPPLPPPDPSTRATPWPTERSWNRADVATGVIGLLAVAPFAGIFVAWFMTATDGLEPEELDGGNGFAILGYLVMTTAGAASLGVLAFLGALHRTGRLPRATAAGFVAVAAVIVVMMAELTFG